MVVKEVMKEIFSVIFGPKNILGSQFWSESPTVSFFTNFTDFRHETETYWVHLNIFIDRKSFSGESIRHLGGLNSMCHTLPSNYWLLITTIYVYC